MLIVPASGCRKPPIMRSSEVLPQPLAPSSTITSPGSTCSDSPSSAWSWPYRLLTPSISSDAMVVPGRSGIEPVELRFRLDALEPRQKPRRLAAQRRGQRQELVAQLISVEGQPRHARHVVQRATEDTRVMQF